MIEAYYYCINILVLPLIIDIIKYNSKIKNDLYLHYYSFDLNNKYIYFNYFLQILKHCYLTYYFLYYYYLHR